MINVKEKKLNNMTFIDLFAGIGGFRLALESLGAKCVYSNEWDKDAQKVYFNNFNDYPEGDITKVNENSIPNHDILCGGFPCQAFSISGKQRGFNDTRGTLFFDIARIVRCKMPKIIFMENVKNFAKHNNGETLKVVENTIKDLGYSFYYKVLNAADYGIPQKRERIYMVAFRNDLNINDFEFPKTIPLLKNVENILENESEIPKKLYSTRKDTTINKNISNVFSNKPVRVGQINKGGQGERIYGTNGVAITLSAYGGGYFSKTGGYLTKKGIRKLSPRECANLMGFPKTYQIASNDGIAYKQFGNSVVIDVLQMIGIEISKAILN